VSGSAKLLLLLAARGGVAREDLVELLHAEGPLLATRLPEPGRSALAMVRVEDDPFAVGGAPMRAFEATLELRCEAENATRAFAAAVDEFADRVSDRLHVDLSAALVGEDHVVLPCGPTPVRYQYVMRRRVDLSHARYADHYRNVHADFGRRTPGIEGYVQFHVDREASHAVAETAGLGLWDADSVSELHLASVKTFLDAISGWSEREAPIDDEENFVDRRNSVMFCSEAVALRLGGPRAR
jgi:hypothetical protein